MDGWMDGRNLEKNCCCCLGKGKNYLRVLSKVTGAREHEQPFTFSRIGPSMEAVGVVVK